MNAEKRITGVPGHPYRWQDTPVRNHAPRHSVYKSPTEDRVKLCLIAAVIVTVAAFIVICLISHMRLTGLNQELQGHNSRNQELSEQIESCTIELNSEMAYKKVTQRAEEELYMVFGSQYASKEINLPNRGATQTASK